MCAWQWAGATRNARAQRRADRHTRLGLTSAPQRRTPTPYLPSRRASRGSRAAGRFWTVRSPCSTAVSTAGTLAAITGSDGSSARRQSESQRACSAGQSASRALTRPDGPTVGGAPRCAPICCRREMRTICLDAIVPAPRWREHGHGRRQDAARGARCSQAGEWQSARRARPRARPSTGGRPTRRWARAAAERPPGHWATPRRSPRAAAGRHSGAHWRCGPSMRSAPAAAPVT